MGILIKLNQRPHMILCQSDVMPLGKLRYNYRKRYWDISLMHCRKKQWNLLLQSRFACRRTITLADPSLLALYNFVKQQISTQPNPRIKPNHVYIYFRVKIRINVRSRGGGWLGSRVVSVQDSRAEGPGFKSQPRRYRVTVLGKLFTPIVPLFN